MADTIVNTPSGTGSDNTAAGWAVAVIVIIALLLAGFFLVRRGVTPAVPNTGTDINVTVPSGTGGTGGTGGAAY